MRITKLDIVEALLGDLVARPSGEGSWGLLSADDDLPVFVAALGYTKTVPDTVIPMITRWEEGDKCISIPPFLLSGDREAVREALCRHVDRLFDALESIKAGD